MKLTHWLKSSKIAEEKVSDNSPIYVYRELLNVDQLSVWAKQQGFSTLCQNLHTTVACSKTPVSWKSIKLDKDQVWVTSSIVSQSLNCSLVILDDLVLEERQKEFAKLGVEDYGTSMTLSLETKAQGAVLPFALKFGGEKVRSYTIVPAEHLNAFTELVGVKPRLSHWFKTLTQEQKDEYLKTHPNSKLSVWNLHSKDAK